MSSKTAKTSRRNKEQTLKTLCDLDKRVIKDGEELMQLAKMYNVKAALYRLGANQRMVTAHAYMHVRKCAIGKALREGGVTVKRLCELLEEMAQRLARNRHMNF